MVVRKSIIPKIVAVQGGVDPDACIFVSVDQEITMLSLEQIERAGRVFAVNIKSGDFGEYITCQGFDIASLNAGDVLTIGNVSLKVTSIGRVNAFQIVTSPDLPPLLYRHGIYMRVLREGRLCVGDKIQR